MDKEESSHAVVFVPQEGLLSKVILLWSAIVVWVGWIMSSYDPAKVVGIIVNFNLVFFYASPLQSIFQVIRTQSSDSIHVGTVIMNILNTSFWTIYGIAQGDLIIIIPNALGLLLGVAQGVVCLVYPRKEESDDEVHDDAEAADEKTRLKRYQTQATSRMSSMSTY